MIISYFDTVRPAFTPSEANTVLLIDSNTVLATPITSERFKVVSRGNFQFIKRLNGIQLIQFPGGHLPKGAGTGFSSTFAIHTIEQVFRCAILE